MFNAVLKHFDGLETILKVPGVRKENGYVMVPESVTLDNGQFFTLNKKIKIINYFEYHESKGPKIPFREDLH